jgi:hypothetical protein
MGLPRRAGYRGRVMATKARKDWGKIDAYLPLPTLLRIYLDTAKAQWDRMGR